MTPTPEQVSRLEEAKLRGRQAMIFTHPTIADVDRALLVAEVDSLTRQRDEAKREGVREAIAAMGQEYGSRIYLSYLDVWLRDKAPFAWDRAALAVTAPPETPTETWTQLTDRQFKELTEAGHTTECQRVMSVGDMPLYSCDCPASANCVHYLKVDETENVSYCIHCGAIDPPETPGEKLLRDIFTDETQRSLWQVKLISTGVLLTLPKKMAETQALADALEAAGHDIELVRAVPATPVEEDRP